MKTTVKHDIKKPVSSFQRDAANLIPQQWGRSDASGNLGGPEPMSSPSGLCVGTSVYRGQLDDTALSRFHLNGVIYFAGNLQTQPQCISFCKLFVGIGWQKGIKTLRNTINPQKPPILPSQSQVRVLKLSPQCLFR